MVSSEDITAFEYFDEGNESLRNPDTYLNKTPLDMVKHFARVYGQTLGHPWVKDTDKDLLRLVLLKEEYAEVLSAVDAENLLKELADLVYVTYGYAATFNWNLDEAVRRVHASNMSKLDTDGKPIYREDGKVLKGPNYAEPNLTDLV
jgi:predicted HAD superfamily Cof-like phosphohydrolase